MERILEENNAVAWKVSDFLNHTPTAINAHLIAEINPDGAIPEEDAYAALLAGFCGVESEVEQWYFANMVRKCRPDDYDSDPYFADISFPETSKDGWALRYDAYEPYEAFPCGDLKVSEEGREVPQLGYFDKPFSYPAIYQDGREWMSLKPNEIETMREAIEKVSGDVAVFGLGLGYFAYRASLKDNVTSVTVIERDPAVISLFKEVLLPQFKHADKIRIIEADAFDILEGEPLDADWAFVDLWHDSGDGPALYVRCKKAEARHRRTRFLYWIETSLRSALRWAIAASAETGSSR